MRILSLSIFFAAMLAAAAPASYDFKDPKGVNAISFFVDSPLEPIVGHAGQVSGTITFDTDAVEATTGSISIPAAAVTFPNAKMTKVLHGEDWLNVAKNKTISFTIKNVTDSKATDAGHTLTVEGAFTLNGVTKFITVPLDVRYTKGGAEKRGAGAGDLLTVGCSFTINRSAYNIKPGAILDKVGNEIDVRFGLAGYPAK